MKTFNSILAGCFFLSVFVFSNVSFAQKILYTPGDATVAQTYFFEIKENILDAVKNSVNFDPSMYASISTKKIDIIEENGKTVKFSFTYSKMNVLNVLDYSSQNPNLIGVNLIENELAVGWLSCDNCRDKDVKYAKKLVDAFYALKFTKFYRINMNDELNKFKPVAEQYQSLNPKPELNEDARKLIVQATSSAKEKKYFNAIKLYQKAIETDQSYPESHFNIALLLAQEEDYEYAMLEMKKYIMLVPDAKDARSAQDKIYEWEVYLK